MRRIEQLRGLVARALERSRAWFIADVVDETASVLIPAHWIFLAGDPVPAWMAEVHGDTRVRLFFAVDCEAFRWDRGCAVAPLMPLPIDEPYLLDARLPKGERLRGLVQFSSPAGTRTAMSSTARMWSEESARRARQVAQRPRGVS